ncbi:class I SAM-dependent methyltransferase [Kitasatospora aureofaciens]|uniref:class I SAM-dependent methyltransferase n=1 Tax=Kitasatospora aureofaciens TaxID=1894 RepID=UPI001C45B558|nr:class I SAM-dependent methyltransferase [Kitasatospora aureofaciens]MBV6702062.1 class I SAM-dependent methyltransferase [Kitasatospora aureofaciens]
MTTTTTMDWDRAYKAGDHHQYWELSAPSPDLVGFLAATPPAPGARALDLGCGTGWDTVALARAGYRATGVDISPEAIGLAVARAAELDLEIDLLVGDVRELDLPDEEFELLVDRGCFHHLGPEDRDRYVTEVARLLRPGGLLYLRGSRGGTFPFKPVDAPSLARHFPPDQFSTGPLMPFQLHTDVLKLDANAVLLRRAD